MKNTVYRADEQELVRAYYGNVNTVQAVESSVSPVPAEIVEIKHRETDRWGEYLQGEGEIYAIFKVGDRYFRQYGYKSSYGDDVSFGGVVEEVYPEEKTVYTFRSKA